MASSSRVANYRSCKAGGIDPLSLLHLPISPRLIQPDLPCSPTIEYKKGGKEAAATTTAKGFGTDTGGWGQSGPSGQSVNPPSASAIGASATTGLAPAPRIVAAGPSSNGGQVEGITSQLASMTAGGKDTWEISLEDSDFDDGWQPPKKDNKPPPIQKDEWYEGKPSQAMCWRRAILAGDYSLTIITAACRSSHLVAYEFVKSFAHYGGAILAVDVESWDRDQDVSYSNRHQKVQCILCIGFF